MLLYGELSLIVAARALLSDIQKCEPNATHITLQLPECLAVPFCHKCSSYIIKAAK